MSNTRNLVASWIRKGDVIRTLSYTKCNNAVSRMTYHALHKAEPGDVIEVSHRHTGLWVGTIKVGVGKLSTSWLWS